MGGRGSQTFKKRQKEQQRLEKRQAKIAKRLERKRQGPMPPEPEPGAEPEPGTESEHPAPASEGEQL